MKIGVIQFPGSNCDRDALSTSKSLLSGAWAEAANAKGEASYIWHRDTSMPKLDLVIVPGGFSYGDYLRSGAMAARSPIMAAIKRHASEGRYVMGICNGFQILTESGLLPGTLMRNAGLSFVCRHVHLRVENNQTVFTSQYQKDQVLEVPVAHHDGNYTADSDTIKAIEDNAQVAFRYCSPEGKLAVSYNPNGSLNHIAGIFNKEKNVLGMMPHPERVCDIATGGTDGKGVFLSLLAA
ncbi:MAG: phosphoribosylformylglycinamidine synthase subunit PurQ [Rickettsiales bacterium]